MNRCLKTVVSCGIFGAFSSGFGALSGLTGNAILSSAGYTGFDGKNGEAAALVCLGGAITGVFDGLMYSLLLGAVYKCLTSSPDSTCSRFLKWVGSSSSSSSSSSNSSSDSTKFIGEMVLASLIGYGVYNAYTSSALTLGQTVAAAAVGSAVLSIPAGCALLCCIMPYVLKDFIDLVAEIEEQKEAQDQDAVVSSAYARL